MTNKITKPRVARTRNSKTMTESMFWGFIRSALRRRTMVWKPITEAKLAAKRPYKGTNKRQKVEYVCAGCNKGFPEKEVIVDHIIEAGSLTCKEDLPGFIERLFCEKEGYQVLCSNCHYIKTQAQPRKNRKK